MLSALRRPRPGSHGAGTGIGGGGAIHAQTRAHLHLCLRPTTASLAAAAATRTRFALSLPPRPYNAQTPARPFAASAPARRHGSNRTVLEFLRQQVEYLREVVGDSRDQEWLQDLQDRMPNLERSKELLQLEHTQLIKRLVEIKQRQPRFTARDRDLVKQRRMREECMREDKITRQDEWRKRKAELDFRWENEFLPPSLGEKPGELVQMPDRTESWQEMTRIEKHRRRIIHGEIGFRIKDKLDPHEYGPLKPSIPNHKFHRFGLPVDDPDFTKKAVEPRNIITDGTPEPITDPTQHFLTTLPADRNADAPAHYRQVPGLEDIGIWLGTGDWAVDYMVQGLDAIKDSDHAETETELVNFMVSHVLKKPREMQLSAFDMEAPARVRTVRRLNYELSPTDRWVQPPPIDHDGRTYSLPFKPDISYFISREAFPPKYRQRAGYHVNVVSEKKLLHSPYFSIEFVRPLKPPELAHLMMKSSSVLAVYNRYVLKRAALKTLEPHRPRPPGQPRVYRPKLSDIAQLRHYGLIIDGRSFEIWLTEPELSSKGVWQGSRTLLLTNGACTSSYPMRMLLKWINEIHRFGLTVHTEGVVDDVVRLIEDQVDEIEFVKEKNRLKKEAAEASGIGLEKGHDAFAEEEGAAQEDAFGVTEESNEYNGHDRDFVSSQALDKGTEKQQWEDPFNEFSVEESNEYNGHDRGLVSSEALAKGTKRQQWKDPFSDQFPADTGYSPRKNTNSLFAKPLPIKGTRPFSTLAPMCASNAAEEQIKGDKKAARPAKTKKTWREKMEKRIRDSERKAERKEKERKEKEKKKEMKERKKRAAEEAAAEEAAAEEAAVEEAAVEEAAVEETVVEEAAAEEAAAEEELVHEQEDTADAPILVPRKSSPRIRRLENPVAKQALKEQTKKEKQKVEQEQQPSTESLAAAEPRDEGFELWTEIQKHRTRKDKAKVMGKLEEWKAENQMLKRRYGVYKRAKGAEKRKELKAAEREAAEQDAARARELEQLEVQQPVETEASSPVEAEASSPVADEATSSVVEAEVIKPGRKEGETEKEYRARKKEERRVRYQRAQEQEQLKAQQPIEASASAEAEATASRPIADQATPSAAEPGAAAEAESEAPNPEPALLTKKAPSPQQAVEKAQRKEKWLAVVEKEAQARAEWKREQEWRSQNPEADEERIADLTMEEIEALEREEKRVARFHMHMEKREAKFLAKKAAAASAAAEEEAVEEDGEGEQESQMRPALEETEPEPEPTWHDPFGTDWSTDDVHPGDTGDEAAAQLKKVIDTETRARAADLEKTLRAEVKEEQARRTAWRPGVRYAHVDVNGRWIGVRKTVGPMVRRVGAEVGKRK